MAFDTSHSGWSGADSAQSLLADIVEDTSQQAEREKREFAQLLADRAEEIERSRQRRLQRERETARIRISIEEERCAARERRARLKLEGRAPKKRRTWALPSPKTRKRAPTPLSERLPKPPEARKPRPESSLLPTPPDLTNERAPSSEVTADEQGYEVISAIPTPPTGLPRVEPPPPPTAPPARRVVHGAAQPRAASKTARSSDAPVEAATDSPFRVETILAGLIVACASMCAGFYWADNAAYEPDVTTYMKAHYKPLKQIDPQREVGFIPTSRGVLRAQTAAVATGDAVFITVRERSIDSDY